MNFYSWSYGLDGGAVSLEQHDKRFHPNGYKEGDSCKFRNQHPELVATQQKLDNVDALSVHQKVQPQNSIYSKSIELSKTIDKKYDELGSWNYDLIMISDWYAGKFENPIEKDNDKKIRDKINSLLSEFQNHIDGLKNAIRGYSKNPNNDSERILLEEYNSSNKNIQDIKKSIDEYKKLLHNATIRRFKFVLNSPMCKKSNISSLTSQCKKMSLNGKDDYEKKKFYDFIPAINALAQKRDDKIIEQKKYYDDAVKAIETCVDSYSFRKSLTHALGELEQMSWINDEYENGKKYIENEVKDALAESTKTTPEKHQQDVVEWTDKMKKNAEWLVAFYGDQEDELEEEEITYDDMDKQEAQSSAIHSIERKFKDVGKELPQDIRNCLESLDPRISCNLAYFIPEINFVNDQQAYCDGRGSITMSSRRGHYSSMFTFFHEAGHSALTPIVNPVKRASKGENIVSFQERKESIMSDITRSIEEETNAFFKSWYGNKSIYGLGTNVSEKYKEINKYIKKHASNLIRVKDNPKENKKYISNAVDAMSDIFCAVTQGNVGEGHTAEYFSAFRMAPLHEVVADIFSMYVTNRDFVKKTFPKTTSLVLSMVFGIPPNEQQ